MTTSCDSQPVTRHADESDEFPRRTEYRDIEWWSDSDLREISRWSPAFWQAAYARRRNSEPFNYLRKTSKQRNHHLERIAGQKLIDMSYTRSTRPELRDHTEATPSGAGKLCEKCLGMSAEKLAQTGGYKHSILSELFNTGKWCKFCSQIAAYFNIRRWRKFTIDRYQIFVSFWESSDDVEVRFDSAKCRQPRSPTGHVNSRAHTPGDSRDIRVEIIDINSSMAPEDDIENVCFFNAPRTFVNSDGSELRSLGSLRMHCLTEEHDPAMEFGIGYVRQIGGDTSSSRSFEIATGWLESCLSAENPPKLERWKTDSIPPDHFQPYCGHEAGGSEVVASNSESASLTSQEPLRLVEIQRDTGEEATSVKVIHTNGHHYEYAALSYCWGKAQPGDSRPWQTKRATLNSHLQGINRQHLPQTLLDAIYICQKLRISYLWVDSLCIIQDSTSDWETEAAKMSGIYLGSLLTLSLSASVSAEHGCFNHTSQSIMERGRRVGSWITIDSRFRDGRSTRLYIQVRQYSGNLFRDEVQHGVLHQRAWTLQEHVMPQRTLYFTSKQLLWECRHCRLSEDNYPQTQGDFLYPICNYSFPLDATAIIEMWYRRVVEDYTRRQLTCRKDKLVAISALARATYLNRHVGYVAGLWRDCIVPGLLWHRDGPGCKSKTYSCPTWSWASQDSPVTYEFATPSDRDPVPSKSYPRVQNVSWDTKPENPFGDVLSAHINLDTTIALGTVLRDNPLGELGHFIATHKTQALIIPGSSQNEIPCANAEMDDADRGGRNVVIANMGHCFLLLEPPSLSSEEYRRVGVSIPYSESQKYGRPVHMDDLTRGWTQRTIRLV